MTLFLRHFVASLSLGDLNDKSSRPKVYCKKNVLKNLPKFTRKHMCRSLFLISPEACSVIKKETSTQVFSYEFWQIFKSHHFYRTTPVPASKMTYWMVKYWLKHIKMQKNRNRSLLKTSENRKVFWCFQEVEEGCIGVELVNN